MSKFQNNLTEGSISQNLLKFSLPFMLSNFIQSTYSVADMFIIGQFNGPESLTGVNLGGQLIMLITNLVMGLATGGTILIAQYLGANKHKDMKETISTMFTLMSIIAVVMTVLVLLMSDVLLSLINTPPEAYIETRNYFTICALGIVFIFGYNVISAILRGMGDSKNPLKFVSIACVVNILLDFLFIGHWGLGTSGAAIATVISQGLSFIISIIYLTRSNFVFKFKLNNFKIYQDKLKLLLSIGLPTSIQNSVSSISFLTLSSLINLYGVNAAAGAGIAGKINNFAILPAIAMSVSVATVSGQNIGAGMYDRAKDTMLVGMKIAFGIGLSIFVIIQVFTAPIVGLFTSQPAAIEFGVIYIRAFSFDYLIVPFAFCANGLVNGSGYTLNSALFSITGSLLFRIPIAFLLGTVLDMGLVGIGLSVPISSFSVFVFCYIFIKSEKWKSPKVIKNIAKV